MNYKTGSSTPRSVMNALRQVRSGIIHERSNPETAELLRNELIWFESEQTFSRAFLTARGEQTLHAMEREDKAGILPQTFGI